MNWFIRMLFVAATVHSSCLFAQVQTVGSKSLNVVVAMEKMHVDPVGINDTLSSRIYDKFIQMMADEFILTQEDKQSLEFHKYQIDDQILKEKSDFYDSLSNILDRNATFLSKEIGDLLSLEEALSNELTYDSKMSTDYPKSKKELLLNWKKHLLISSVRKAQKRFPNTNIDNADSVKIILKFAIEEQIEKELCDLKLFHLNAETAKENQGAYLEAITTSYDPHSSYFSYETKSNFEDMLSASDEKFGFGLEQEEGIWKILFIKPGSDAWSSGLINVGDVILSIKREELSNEELLTECVSLDEISLFLSDADCKTIYMKIRKSDNSEEVVKLDKKKFASELNTMSGLILKDASKVGYIALPSFYSNWDGYQVDGCANDVAKEILKLKKDSIEGLILDLRNNGGGSVREAIDLAGIFVDLGPMGIVKYKEGKPKLLKDFNRGRVYNGPLIVLINGASASASEIVAGALQYHNRALIVGSESYGKATGQIVVPADTAVWASYFMGQSKPEDYVKVTQSLFYSPNNSTHQLVGVQPDISIPSLWDDYYQKEGDKAFALQHPTIVKNVYFKPNLSIPVQELKDSSKARIESDSSFSQMTRLKDSISGSLEKEWSIALDFKNVWNYYKSEDVNAKTLFEATKTFSSDFKVHHSTFNDNINDMDSEFNEMIRKYQKRLERDLTLNESYLIMMDYINIINNK